jgi:hypothetical protein
MNQNNLKKIVFSFWRSFESSSKKLNKDLDVVRLIFLVKGYFKKKDKEAKKKCF